MQTNAQAEKLACLRNNKYFCTVPLAFCCQSHLLLSCAFPLHVVGLNWGNGPPAKDNQKSSQRPANVQHASMQPILMLESCPLKKQQRLLQCHKCSMQLGVSTIFKEMQTNIFRETQPKMHTSSLSASVGFMA